MLIIRSSSIIGRGSHTLHSSLPFKGFRQGNVWRPVLPFICVCFSLPKLFFEYAIFSMYSCQCTPKCSGPENNPTFVPCWQRFWCLHHSKLFTGFSGVNMQKRSLSLFICMCSQQFIPQGVNDGNNLNQTSVVVVRLPVSEYHQTGSRAHSEHRFPAPSSKLCQIWLRHWRGTLYLCTAIHRCGQHPLKGLITNMTGSSLAPT